MKEVLKKMTKQDDETYENKDNKKTLYAFKEFFKNIDDNLYRICDINLNDPNYAKDVVTEMDQ